MSDALEPIHSFTISDQHYLLTDHYKNASNLNARIQLHERFSTNTYDWYRWAFDQIKTRPRSRVLELGCGPGRLWLNNFDRIPKDWQITLSDFSPGMLQEAQRNLQIVRHAFNFQVIDAQAIPFKEKSFDIVIANHMLYHVLDRDKALAEIRRVLTPKGRFYAATNGQAHLREIDDLIKRVEPTYAAHNTNRNTFNLESGLTQLSRWFSQVTVREMDDGLVVTEVEPLIAYILSSPVKSVLVEEKLQALREIVSQEIATHGAVHISKVIGIFEASR